MLFYLLHADKIVDFISTPVMGGFISGIAVTIIMMQIPKLMGSPAGTGEFIELAEHIFQANHKDKLVVLWNGNWSTCNLDCAKIDSKVPDGNRYYDCRSLLDNCLSYGFRYGVVLSRAVQPGLPRLIFPDFTGINLTQAVGRALMVAVVSWQRHFCQRTILHQKTDMNWMTAGNRFCSPAGNLAAGAVGCCPVNGSISRTSMNEQYGERHRLYPLQRD